MADINSGLGWSEAQWERVNSAVTEAFTKASVAGAFLPCYGPLAGSAEYVRAEAINVLKPGRKNENVTVTVTDDTTLKLLNLTVQVELSNEQVADDSLSSALLAFRRAANTLAQREDELVFNGRGPAQVTASELHRASIPPPPATTSALVVVSGQESIRGLINDDTFEQMKESAKRKRKLSRQPAVTSKRKTSPRTSPLPIDVSGKHLVSEIANAVVELETNLHPGPFACVLGKDAFVTAYTPETGSMVLPADRITPILGGPLLRYGLMPGNVGVVVSLAGIDIDLVVATPPKAQFLQTTADAKYLFRVYEKFMFRIKDHTAVQGISV